MQGSLQHMCVPSKMRLHASMQATFACKHAFTCNIRAFANYKEDSFECGMFISHHKRCAVEEMRTKGWGVYNKDNDDDKRMQ